MDINTIDQDQTMLKIYSVQSGDSEEEFYTFSLPVLSNEYITIEKPFKKGVINQTVLNESVEDFYRDTSLQMDIMKFLLSNGILLHEYSIDQLNWFTKSIQDAEKTIKDKIIHTYQNTIPQLLQKINKMETIIKNERSKQDKYSKNDLIDF